MNVPEILPKLLALAWLLPLASFVLIVLFGPRMGKAGRGAGYLAAGAVLVGFVLSVAALVGWLGDYPLTEAGASVNALDAEEGDSPIFAARESGQSPARESGQSPARAPRVEPLSGVWYSLGRFGWLELNVGYYIDGLTVAMFCMVTLVASCIHIYSLGYMHEELHEVTDPLARLRSGQALRRPGRYARYFQSMSLFCFSMLGLVIAGNLAMVFVFWELVGICSYLLIGFYHERRSASNAANKAFIVNRIGDFGMIVGLMAVWAGMGTFSFGNCEQYDERGQPVDRPGIFAQVRPAEGGHRLTVPDGMVCCAARSEVAQITRRAASPAAAQAEIAQSIPKWRSEGYGYGLLVVAGLGIFCGCIGKSAQFPLQVWLPDAMEGPTPVSALIHAATMVAAGVYLVGRFYPVFTPEVLLGIACVGCVTLLIAATIALVQTDIKRVLAYSTVSQLGYMMLALGVGGWLAGMFHLFTHAFFKSLLFLCSGSVIHACGTNEMPQMGGLLRRMPWTAWTMLVGCMAIAGAGIPLVVGLSGYYSKDYILAQTLSLARANPDWGWMFYVAAAGAGITACYMFRMWYLTFVGPPRDEHVHGHAHESPRVMVVPLVILAVLAACAGWKVPGTGLGLEPLLEQARPSVPLDVHAASVVVPPPEHLSHTHEIHAAATWWAFGAAMFGFALATVFYGTRQLDPEGARRIFAPIHAFLRRKWWFDELYDVALVRPVLWVSGCVAAVDKHLIDWLADNAARLVAAISRLDDWIDRVFVDALIDRIAGWTYALGLRLRMVQTGLVRQYVMWIVVATVTLFALVNLYWNQ